RVLPVVEQPARVRAPRLARPARTARRDGVASIAIDMRKLSFAPQMGPEHCVYGEETAQADMGGRNCCLASQLTSAGSATASGREQSLGAMEAPPITAMPGWKPQ